MKSCGAASRLLLLVTAIAAKKAKVEPPESITTKALELMQRGPAAAVEVGLNAIEWIVECASQLANSLPALQPMVEVGVAFVSYAAACLILLACVIAVLHLCLFMLNAAIGARFEAAFFKGPFLRVYGNGPPTLIGIRFSLCSMMLVGLNFLVAVDIVETLIKPSSEYTLEDLYKLAIVAAIRTALAHFLGKEAQELEHEIKEHCPGTALARKITTSPRGGL